MSVDTGILMRPIKAKQLETVKYSKQSHIYFAGFISVKSSLICAAIKCYSLLYGVWRTLSREWDNLSF